jgi:hypothetical protein
VVSEEMAIKVKTIDDLKNPLSDTLLNLSNWFPNMPFWSSPEYILYNATGLDGQYYGDVDKERSANVGYPFVTDRSTPVLI